jgi:hypothetical protein
MSSCQLLQLTGKACELEMSFSIGETVSFSLLQVSPRQCSAWLSPQWLLSCPTPIQGFSVPPHQGEGEIFPLCIWSPVLSRRSAISSPAVLEYVVPSDTLFYTHLVG